jgi:hypothetical protein
MLARFLYVISHFIINPKQTIMKKFTLLFLLTGGLAGTVIAQPTLTSSGIMPVIGNTFTTVSSAWTNPGSAGANQTWNLALTNSATSPSTAVSPSSSPYSSSFPAATVAFNSSGTWVYYKGTSSAWQNNGYVTGAGTVLSYSDMEDMLRFPFTYNNTYTDPWAVTYIQSSYTYYRWGTTTVTADGYGTLTTPDGTFTNVTRVHFVQDYKDSTNIASTPFVITYQNDEYMWYLNGNHNPIAAVYTFTSSMGSPVTGGLYMSGVVSGVNDFAALASLSLAPNPANEQTNFTLNLTEEKEISISLYNSIGQEVGMPVTAAGIAGENKIAVSIAELPDGVYFGMVSLDGAQVSSRRFIVTH